MWEELLCQAIIFMIMIFNREEGIMSEDYIYDYDSYIRMADSHKTSAENYLLEYDFMNAKMQYEEAASIYDKAMNIAWSAGDVVRTRLAENYSSHCNI